MCYLHPSRKNAVPYNSGGFSDASSQDYTNRKATVPSLHAQYKKVIRLEIYYRIILVLHHFISSRLFFTLSKRILTEKVSLVTQSFNWELKSAIASVPG